MTAFHASISYTRSPLEQFGLRYVNGILFLTHFNQVLVGRMLFSVCALCASGRYVGLPNLYCCSYLL